MAIKRSRPTSVCQFCRKRKVKCSKGQPCTTCVKYGNKNCIYESFPNDNEDEKETALLKRLKSQVSELEDKLRFSVKGGNGEISAPVVGITTPQNRSPDPKSPGNSALNIATSMSPLRTPNQFLDFYLPTSYSPLNTGSTKRLSVSNLINESNGHDDTINLFTLYDSVYDMEPIKRRHFGPLSCNSILRADPLLYKLYLNFNNSGKDKFIQSFVNDSNEFKTDQLVVYGNIRSTKNEANKSTRTKKNQVNERAKILGLMFFEGDIESKIELILKIKLILPEPKVIGMLIDRFFNYLYPFFSIIDEFDFRSNLDRIIHNGKINVEKRLDFAYLGMLLVILRLSYLSLFTNIKKVNEDNLFNNKNDQKSLDLKYLLNNPINLEVITIAQICLNQFNLVNSSNLVILQLAIFVRYYKLYGPEYGDESDSGEPQVFSALLIQMAYSLGLHREPDKFKEGCKDEKVNHLGRKIWAVLYILDISTSLTFGDPSSINNFLVDVKPPFVNDVNCNVKNPDLDRIIVLLLNSHSEVFAKLNEIFAIISNVNEKFSIEKLSSMGDYCFTNFANHPDKFEVDNIELLYRKDFSEYTEDGDFQKSFRFYYKTFKLKYYFQISSAIIALNYHFVNYYYKSGNSEKSIFYLKKIFNIFYTRCYPIIVELVTNDTRDLDDVCELIVTPSLQNILHIACLMNLSLLIKLKIAKPGDGQFASNVFYLESVVNKSLQTLIKFMKILGNRYYTPWKDAKILPLLFEEIPKFDTANDTHPGFTNEDLTDLAAIVNTSVDLNTDILQTDNNDSLWLLITALRKNENDHRYFDFLDGEVLVPEVVPEVGDKLDIDNPYLDEIFKDFFPK